MGTFVSYALPGIPTGCEYALMAVGLVITFRATGVFNIAFGAQAFVSAFAFDLLNQYGPHWNQWICFLIAVLDRGPAHGSGARPLPLQAHPDGVDDREARLVARIAGRDTADHSDHLRCDPPLQRRLSLAQPADRLPPRGGYPDKRLADHEHGRDRASSSAA